jgi:hypothetical protein
MNNTMLIKLTLKALLVWMALSLVGFFWGNPLIGTLLPYYEVVVQQVNTNYQPAIHIVEKENDADNIVLTATALKSLAITPQQALPAGRTIESSITVLHALVPLVILFTIIIVWPVDNIKQRAALLLLAIPALFFVSALTAPIQLLGQLEIGFVNAAMQYGFTRDHSWALNWMLFTEGGGRWLIPLLTGISCGGCVRWLIK